MTTEIMIPTWIRHRLRLLWIALFILCVGCAHGFEEGAEALAAGDDARAESIADDELADHPDSPWGNQLKAEILAARGEHRQALEYARQADHSEAFPVRTPRLLGQIYLAIGRPVDAAFAFERAREAEAGSVDDDTYIDALAQGHSHARSRSDQRERWEMISRLAEIAPDHPDATASDVAVARRAYAIDLRRRGEYLEAIDLLRTSLDDDPELLRGEALDLGELYARLDMPDQAREAWEVYLRHDVDEREYTQRHRDVAEMASRYGLLPIAIETMERLLDNFGDDLRHSDIFLELATYQLADDLRSEGRQTIFDYLDLHAAQAADGEVSPVAFDRSSDIAVNSGDTRLAIIVLERGVEEAEPSRILTRKLADIYARRAQFDRVEETLELYISRHDEPSEAILFAGQWARDRNNYELARSYFERAIEDDDAPGEAWHDLAQILGQLERLDEMARILHAFVDRHDGSDDALASAARTFTDHHLYEEAEALLYRLHTRRPQSRRITRQFADLYGEWSRPADAAAVWERWIEARGDDPDDIASVAGVLARNQDYERASRFYVRAAEAGKYDAWLDAADIHLRQQHPAAMVRALDAFIDDHPDRVRALEEAATRYRRAGMEARQIDVLSELIELHPVNWHYYERLTALLLEQGRQNEAYEYLQRFVHASADPEQALDLISAPITSVYPASWLLEFYQSWRDYDDVYPAILRHIGDAYYALSHDDSLAETTRGDARRQARVYYMEFLDVADDEGQDWRRLANLWRQKEMWRPASIAFERYGAQSRRHNIYSIAYAETLLQLGENERATEVLERHFQNEQRRPDAARRIANMLIDFYLYDEAEAFAAHLFVSGDDGNVGRGFRLMASIHNQREDRDALRRLVDDYIERASNTERARRSAVSLLEDMGQWELAAEQLRQLEVSALSQHITSLAIQHYRTGDIDEAWSAFEEASHHVPDPESTWSRAGDFLAARGELDRASQAYDLAVQANPDDLRARTSRGTFTIAQGDIGAGWSDYAFARESTESLTEEQRAEFFDELASAGYFDLARQVVDDSEADGLRLSDSIQQSVGHWKLQSSDRSGADKALDRIRAGTWSIHEAFRDLYNSGHYDIGFELMVEEFEDGDPSTGAFMLLNHASVANHFVGWDRQRRWLRDVIDPLRRSDARLIGPVGDHRARSGQVDDARIYLQSAVDYGDDVYLPQLGHILLLQGERREAFRHFEAYLFDVVADSRALESILLRFELADDARGARLFLDRIAEEPALIDIVLPYRTHYALEHHGDPERAIADLLEDLDRFEELPASAFRDGSSVRTAAGLSKSELIASALVGSLEAVAALGYVETVQSLVDSEELESRVGEHRLRPLHLRLALATGDFEKATLHAEKSLEAADGPQELRQAQLQMAKTFLAFGATEQASQFVDQALSKQTNFRSHEPFILHLGMLTLDGETDLNPVLDDYLARVPNRRSARNTLIAELRRLGRDTEALRLAEQAVDISPTPDNLRLALNSAIDAGDIATVTEMTQRLFHVADDPTELLSEVITPRRFGTEPRLLLPIVEAIRATRPGDLNWVVEHARILFVEGQAEQARSLLVDALEERDFHSLALGTVVEMLSKERLDVELSRVIGPAVPEDQLTPAVIIAFAEADFALGFDDDARDWLEYLAPQTRHSDLWRMDLAHRLAHRLHFEAMGTVLEPLSDSDLGPSAQYLFAIHQLGAGDADLGLENLRKANEDGVDRLWSHIPALRAAMHSGQTDIALALMDDVAGVALRDNDFVSIPLRIMLRAVMPMDDGSPTVRLFLEDRLPRLVDGHGATWTQFAGLLAKSFEDTGDPEGAYGFYRDRIWQALLSRDADALPIYLNNLAYTYSTTDAHLDRGMDKIRRAIVLHDERSSSLIDTLGWLYYRQGDLLNAELEVRRALRTFDGRTWGLDEMLHHLEIVLHDRGIHREATFIHTRRQRLPMDDVGW